MPEATWKVGPDALQADSPIQINAPQRGGVYRTKLGIKFTLEGGRKLRFAPDPMIIVPRSMQSRIEFSNIVRTSDTSYEFDVAVAAFDFEAEGIEFRTETVDANGVDPKVLQINFVDEQNLPGLILLIKAKEDLPNPGPDSKPGNICEDYDDKLGRKPITIMVNEELITFTSRVVRDAYPATKTEWSVLDFVESRFRDPLDTYQPPSVKIVEPLSADGATVMLEFIGELLVNSSYWLRLRVKYWDHRGEPKFSTFIFLLTTKS